ncbi:hypothetical protein PhCBS80983_g04558 [Powellomyces hirtus]|uniref:Transmembrane protein 188 n=1 Tax=Powellomyces hirtus TaxID=109895 RepID=A0A507DX88_9FUNG|nr:hypothetical protein PhCBS80983_g04558 [Powellomyces hirtus]
MLRRRPSFPPPAAPSLESVTIGREHVPLLGRPDLASPVANVDTVPSMNIPRAAFEKRFHATEEAFKDLARFESRLRHNELKGRRSQLRWQVGISLLFLLLAYCSFRIFLTTHDPHHPHPSTTASSPQQQQQQRIPAQTTWHVLGATLALSALIIFWTSGSFRAKIVDASYHTTRCNNALRPFNMHLNTTPNHHLAFGPKVPPEFRTAYARFRAVAPPDDLVYSD